MKKYLLALTSQNGRDNIETTLTNIKTGESRVEQWERVDGEWIFQQAWGDAENGLFQVLYENSERTNELLTACEASVYGEIEFNA